MSEHTGNDDLRPVMRRLCESAAEFGPSYSQWSDCWHLLSVLLAEMYLRRSNERTLPEFLAEMTKKGGNLQQDIEHWLAEE